MILSTLFSSINTGRGFLAPREPWIDAACAKYPSFTSKGKLVNSRAGDEKFVEIRCEPSSHSVARSSQPRQQQQASPSVRVIFSFVCSVHVRSRIYSSLRSDSSMQNEETEIQKRSAAHHVKVLLPL